MGYIETDKVELKRILNDSFEKEVVAFLNSHDGTIYIGVEDNGTIIGVNNVDKLMKEIFYIITDKILPDCKKYVHPSAILEEGKMIIKVDVNKGNSLYYIKKYGRSASGCYIRIGTTCKSMSEEEIEKSYIKTLNIPEYSLIEEESYLQDLTFNTLKIFLDNKGINYNDNNFYKNNKLLTSNGKFNYLAFILSEQFDLSFKIAKFDGNNKRGEFIYRKEFGNCSLLKIITSVPEYIENNINVVRSYFDRGVIRRDEFLLDKNSVREAWLNCCIHNDYSTHLGPAVFVYNDHIEFFSYGNPLKKQTKEDFLMGISKPVNPELADILMKLGIIEQSGKGINTIVNHYGKEVFNFSDNYLQVNLPYNKDSLFSNDAQNENVYENVNHNDNEMIILNIIKDNPRILRKDIFAISGISRATGDRILKKLKDLGVLERVGSDKNGHWKIKE